MEREEGRSPTSWSRVMWAIPVQLVSAVGRKPLDQLRQEHNTLLSLTMDPQWSLQDTSHAPHSLVLYGDMSPLHQPDTVGTRDGVGGHEMML